MENFDSSPEHLNFMSFARKSRMIQKSKLIASIFAVLVYCMTPAISLAAEEAGSSSSGSAGSSASGAGGAGGAGGGDGGGDSDARQVVTFHRYCAADFSLARVPRRDLIALIIRNR